MLSFDFASSASAEARSASRRSRTVAMRRELSVSAGRHSLCTTRRDLRETASAHVELRLDLAQLHPEEHERREARDEQRDDEEVGGHRSRRS